MRKAVFVLALLLCAMSALILLPGPAAAQDSTISIASLDTDTFVTVQKTGNGDIISLYQVSGDRVRLVDIIVNGTSRDVNMPRRYIHHIEMENR